MAFMIRFKQKCIRLHLVLIGSLMFGVPKRDRKRHRAVPRSRSVKIGPAAPIVSSQDSSKMMWQGSGVTWGNGLLD